ncbi:prolipoprotein diacylglyceryl transferase family protein [Hymenobacter monticola]|uniref:prolipoprotein diacylglyceryl transferase family protein n=1 Tax=Hymenobacter monticola TaxID=1705399 RepID=UPI0021D47D1E|nr:prolipoprotein diacylglyceryl transferase family protein [Hymenobacter monticola]
MHIPYTPGHDYYTPFYLLATLTNVLLLLWEGWRRGFPLRPWLTLVAASSLALILGSKLITHPVGEWAAVLFTNAPADTARSILGGGLAAGLTVVALRRWLGLSWAVLDALALPLCAALMVQCVGCVLTGCCFGVTTTGWGLTYAADTLPWAAQVLRGALLAHAAHSLPVVPTQLWALALCAAVGGVLLATRKRRWPVGSWLLLQTGLLLLGRFGLSFWRDAVGEPLAGTVHSVLGGQWLGLQFLLLPAGLLALGLWLWRVRRRMAVEDAVVATSGQGRRLWVVAGLLGSTALLGPAALTLPEVLAVKGLLLVVLLAEAGAALVSAVNANAREWRLAGLPLSGGLIVLILVTTAQTPAPEQAPLPGQGPTRTLTVTGGVLGNQHEAYERIQLNNTGCSGSQQLALQQQVAAAGGEVAFETSGLTNAFGQPIDKTTTWGGGLWVGRQRIDAQPLPGQSGSYAGITDRDTTFRPTLVDVHVYKQIHRERGWRSFDVRLGLHLGQLGYFSYFGDGESRESTLLMPEVMVRLGHPDLLFGQADFCYGAENVLGAYTSRLGVGSGLGMRNGPQLLVGYAHSPHYPTPSMGFASALLRLPSHPSLSLEPYVATDFGRHNSVSLKLNYRIGR